VVVVVVDLSSIRSAAGMTQVQLAAALGTTQGQVSRLERQSDMLLSTLRAYLSALGADASLTVTVGGQTFSGVLTEGG
jgi:transcriptional regulator with XRE-family HTH domain